MDVLEHRNLIAKHAGIDPKRIALRFHPTQISVQEMTEDERTRLESAVYSYWKDLGPLTEAQETQVEMLWAKARLVSQDPGAPRV